MFIVHLGNNRSATVDEEDYAHINRWKWSLNGSGYAHRVVAIEGKQSHIYMHRTIAAAKPGQIVDHINHDTLDNRKSNLRVCEHNENIRNRVKQSNNSSGYIGVSRTHNGKWRAYGGSRDSVKHLGVFDSAILAAQARDSYVTKSYGEFAQLNFSKGI